MLHGIGRLPTHPDVKPKSSAFGGLPHRPAWLIRRGMNFIDRIPVLALVMVAIMMALAPFSPEPHLVEKYHMLVSGKLTKAIDIFDVFWHLLPSILLAIRIYRMKQRG